MARESKVIETVTCDVCGRKAEPATTVRIGWDQDTWELDLCSKDLGRIEKSFDELISAGRSVPRGRRSGNRPSRPTPREREERWAVLEGLGFTRHPGRLSAEEIAALEAAGIR